MSSYSHPGPPLLQLLNEISTCRSELKKLARILVGSDPELFPLPEDSKQPFEDKAAPEIRGIAAKSAKRSTQSRTFHDPGHVHTSVTACLIDFAFLNDPPIATASI